MLIVGFSWRIAAGGTIYVDATAPGPIHDGISWATAYRYLQDALVNAANGDDIRVAEGTYRPDEGGAAAPGDRYATFGLINGVRLYGGFASGGVAFSQRDPQIYETILSGDLAGNDTGGLNDPSRNENSYHVVTGSGTSATAVLDGFTVTAGNADGGYPHLYGGGMFNDGGSPTVSDCKFVGNYASSSGGGMYNEYWSSLTVKDCIFIGNEAGDYGGGICNFDHSDLTVTNCIFSGNSVSRDGGGMRNTISSPTLVNCIFSGNSAAGKGGGISNENQCSPVLANCTLSQNSANRGGGMYNMSISSSTLTNCVVWGNTAVSGGSQIGLQAGSVLTVSYCDVEGGQVAIYNSASSINWGAGNIDADPVFADANGPDDMAGTADDDLRVLYNSVCIDAGDNSAVPVGTTSDLDGHARFADGDCNSAAVADFGAYEFDFVYLGDFDNECDVDFYDFAILAAAWLTADGQTAWNPDCDIAVPVNEIIDMQDVSVFADNWLAGVGN